MSRGKIFGLVLAFLLIIPLATSQNIEVSTDHGYLNADGDRIQLEYGDLSKSDINNLDLLIDNHSVIEFSPEQESIFFTYNDSLNGSENASLRINYQNNTNKTQNIDEEVIRYRGNLTGFHIDGSKINRNIYYRELEDAKAKISVEAYNGNESFSSTGLTGEDFNIKSESGDTGADLELSGDSQSPYSFNFDSIPRMGVGVKRFDITMENGPELGDFKIEKRATFEGKILRKTGEGKKAEFELLDESISKFESDKNGYFFKLLESGSINRDLKLDLGKVTTTFSGINITSREQEDIRYEFYRGLDPSEVETDKLLKPVNLMAFSSNYPMDIDETSITMNYNTSDIDPSEVEVYECTYWDFFGERCRVDWEKKEDVENKELLGKFEINNVETKGDGEYGMKSAYMAAIKYERPRIQLKENVLPEKRTYNIDDQVVIEGSVKNSKDEKPVQDANVEVKIYNEENNSVSSVRKGEDSLKTDGNGFFSFTPIEVPDKEGNYSINLSIEKAGFNNLSKIYGNAVEVEKSREISISSPEREAEPGDRNTVVFTIENNGQAKIDNISISEVNDISEEYYTLSSTQIEGLAPGDSSTVTLISMLPSDYCEENRCSQKTFKIQVDGVSGTEKLSKSSKINIKSTEEVKESGSSEDQQENDSKDSNNTDNTSEQNAKSKNSSSKEVNGSEKENSLSSITGDFMEMEKEKRLETVVIGLLIVLVTLMILVIKKKKSSSKSSKKASRKDGKTKNRKQKAGKILAPFKKLSGLIKEQINSSNDKENESKVKNTGENNESVGSGDEDKNSREELLSRPKVSPSKQSLEKKDNKETVNDDGRNKADEDVENKETQTKEKNSEALNADSEHYLRCPECDQSFDTEAAFKLHEQHHH